MLLCWQCVVMSVLCFFFLDKTSLKNSSTKEGGPIVENGKKKGKEERPPTKVLKN